MKFNTIILAAGMGKRLKTNTCKVIVQLINKPLIIHLLDNLKDSISPENTFIVIGHEGEAVKKVVSSSYPEAKYAWQKEQLGTGHAVLQTKPLLTNLEIPTLILAGDVPLINSELIRNFQEFHLNKKADISVLTTKLVNPHGYGRIIRDKQHNSLLKIVEEKDASLDEKDITEINSGIYFVNSAILFSLLAKVTPNNKQNEYYLTDIIKIAVKENMNIQPYLFDNAELLRGINSREDLATMADYIYKSTLQRHMQNGVTIISPQTTFIEPEAIIESDVIIEPFVHIKGHSHIKEQTIVKSFSYLNNYSSKVKEVVSSHFKNN